VSLYADRVKDSTTTVGTGSITLSGTAPTGYQSFLTAFGSTPLTVAYCIADQSGPNWEVGTGVFNGTTGLTRVTVLASSGGGALVAFTAGTKDVFCTAPAKYLDPFTSTNQGTVPASGGGTTNFLRADGTFAIPASTVGVCWSLVGTTVVGDYTVLFKAPFAFTIDETSMICVSGSATATVKINTTNVTGGTAIGGGSQSVGTTTTTVSRTSANTVNSGDSIVVTFTAGAVNPSVTIKGTKT